MMTTTTTNGNGTTGSNGGEDKKSAVSWVSKSTIRFALCGFVYLTYYMSLTIIGQFLSLFFQWKGFGGKTMGMLSSVAPLTSFLLTPVWGRVMNRRSKEDSSSGRTVSLPLLYVTIAFSVIFQTSLIFVNDFTSMMLIKTLSGIFHAPVKPLLDALIIDHIDKSIFGKVRLFGIVGSGLGAYCGGKLLLYVPPMDESDSSNAPFMSNLFSGYNLLFLLHALMLIPTAIGIQSLKYLDDGLPSFSSPSASEKENEDPSLLSNTTQQSPSKGAASYIVQEFDHVLFFLIIYVMGTSGGVNDTFTYPRFREVGLDTNHMGISRMCCSVAGGIMFWYSASLGDALGRENVLILSLVCNGVRFWLLKVMDQPFQGYLAEGIRGGIFGSFWSSATIYASQIGPPTLRPTLLLVLNGVYNGIGRSTGSLLGGRIQAELGTESLFGLVATTNLSVAVSVFFYQHVLRKSKRHKHIQ